MAQSKKTTATEKAKEKTAVETPETITEQPAVSEATTPVKATSRRRASKAAVTEPADESKSENKKRGRKPKGTADASSKTEEKPAVKRTTRRTRNTAAPAQSDFEKFVSDVRKKTEKAKPSFDFAAQITINGKTDGIFYVKAAGGTVYTEGYDYVGADLYVTADSETFAALLKGKGDFDTAVRDGKLEIVGAPLSTIYAFKSIVF